MTSQKRSRVITEKPLIHSPFQNYRLPHSPLAPIYSQSLKKTLISESVTFFHAQPHGHHPPATASPNLLSTVPFFLAYIFVPLTRIFMTSECQNTLKTRNLVTLDSQSSHHGSNGCAIWSKHGRRDFYCSLTTGLFGFSS